MLISGIVGSGNVGANTAFFIAEQGSADVLLHDIKDGIAAGKGLDIMEAAPIRGYRSHLAGVRRLEDLAPARVVVIAAGRVREPGQRRVDLLENNQAVIRDLAGHLKTIAPQAIYIIATEPVDAMTVEFAAVAGLRRGQVMGLGGFLDVTRFRYAIARELDLSVESVMATIIGRHSADMIGLPEYCSVSGVPLTDLLSEQRIAALLEEVRGAGDNIVDLAQRSSAYYGPSAAAAELVDAVCRDLKRIVSVSVPLQGEYGFRRGAASLPAVIGAQGVERVLLPRLSDAQHGRLAASLAAEH